MVDNDDRKTLDWIHRDADERFNTTVQFSIDDIGYLQEHLFFNLMSLMPGR